MIRAAGFRHEALLYRSDAEFLDAAAVFIKQGLADGAPTLVVVDAGKIARLREQLGADSDQIEFADMASVGQNPARIIPAWREFVDRHEGTGRPLRGIGEPIWPGRSADELVECRHHEALLNVAFADTPAFRLLCPYDATALDPVVVDEAHGTHPFVCTPDHQAASPYYDGTDPGRLFTEPLRGPPTEAATLAFDELRPVRRFVTEYAMAAGIAPSGLSDVVLAVNEIAANSLSHGGGRGWLAMWTDDDTLVCQVDDAGRIVDPLVGRRPPIGPQLGGRGLWIANQLCQLMQIRTTDLGTTVRLHFRGGGG